MAIVVVLIVLVAGGIYAASTFGLLGENAPTGAGSTESTSEPTSESTSVSTESTSESTSEPASVAVSGSVNTTGQGTAASSISFTSGSETFTISVVNGTYSATLPNLFRYNVSVSWKGGYPWQGGMVQAGEYSLNQTSPTASKDWVAETPDSEVTVSGNVVTTGYGTWPSQIQFVGRGGFFNESFILYTTTGGPDNYSLVLPNKDTYSVTVSWKGECDWQYGTRAFKSTVNSSVGVHTWALNFSVDTPASVVKVYGIVSTYGFGTAPTFIDFSYGTTSYHVAVDSSGEYVTELGNSVRWSVTVEWSNGFGSGTCSAGTLNLDFTDSTIRSYEVDFAR